MRRAPRRRTAVAVGNVAPLPAAPAEHPALRGVTRLVSFDRGFYAIRLAGHDIGRRATIAGLALPALQICGLPQAGTVDITDPFGRPASWLRGRDEMLFAAAPSGGGAVLVTAYLNGAPGAVPPQLEIQRIDVPAPEGWRLITLEGEEEQPPRRPASLEVIAHIRERGDIRFVDAEWVGRVQPGLWIEALTILPRDPAAAAAIEYKGLTASGAETPWISAGLPCGTRGQGVPLIGFAVRQKTAAGEAPFDCEYTGYFASGTMAGPARNGTPCRSRLADDPLEGMRLRLIPRLQAAVSG